MISIICGDPAEKGDYFAIVGVDLDLKRQWVFPKYAKQWQYRTFTTVAKEIKPVIKKIRPKFFGLETNYEGPKVLAAFSKEGIPAKGISSVGTLTDENRKFWQSMDSSYTIRWMKDMKFSQCFRWSAKPSKHMRILEDQVAEIEEKRTPSGHISYGGKKGRHDDLFSAFKLCCHIARVYIERDEDA